MALSAYKDVDIRFSEVDSMHIVWHGNYIQYFEDAREAFGQKYDITYLKIYEGGCYTPLVDISVKFKKPLTVGKRARVTAVWKACDAAKIVFDYEVTDLEDGSLVATGHSVQVFMDRDYKLLWNAPEFYEQWKKKWESEM